MISSPIRVNTTSNCPFSGTDTESAPMEVSFLRGQAPGSPHLLGTDTLAGGVSLTPASSNLRVSGSFSAMVSGSC